MKTEATKAHPGVIYESKRLCNDFPMRPDFLAQVVIPRDMTKAEAQRLANFVLALAVDNP